MPRTTTAKRIERARPEAATLLGLPMDALEAADPGLKFSEKLVNLACLDYKLRFPEWSKHFRGAINPWLFHDGDRTTKKIRVGRDGKPKSDRVDVFCLFCRVMLVNGAIWDFDYTERLRTHTTLCALKSLAGQMEPGAPGTYKLPEAV